MTNIKHIITFLTIIDEKSFAAAGRKLGLTKAAISKQITTLEEELKMQLLHRTTRQLTLTDAGQLFYEYAQKLARDVREMETLFSSMKAEPSGHLKIGSSWHFAENILIPNLVEFYDKYPKISLEIMIIERIPDLAKEVIDINIGHSFVGGPDDIHRKIGETTYACCASPSYLETFGTPNKPEDLIKHRYLAHKMCKPDNVLKFGKKEIHLEPFLRMDDSRAMIQCALHGLGIMKLHRYAFAKELKKGLLVEVLKDWDDTREPINLCYQPQRYVQPKIRHFIDFFCSKVPKNCF